MSFINFYNRAASGKDKSLSAKALTNILSPAGFVYASVPAIKEFLYGRNILKSEKMPVPVISIGNLSWGGTGKTPAVIAVSELFKKNSIPHAILSRGYGSSGSSDETVVISDGNKILQHPPIASDENYLIAKNLPGVPVIQGRDRCTGGKIAIERFNSECLILDDGYQYLKMKRDLDIMLWDSRVFPSDVRPIPAGNLREFISASCRSDIIILTKTNQMGKQAMACDLFFTRMTQGKPIYHALHETAGIVEYGNESLTIKSGELAGKKTVAFCAIADPDSFFSTVSEEGFSITDSIAFRDHHNYTENDVVMLKKAVERSGAELLITTEKDICRNGELLKKAGPLLYPKIRFRAVEDKAFEDMILRTVG